MENREDIPRVEWVFRELKRLYDIIPDSNLFKEEVIEGLREIRGDEERLEKQIREVVLEAIGNGKAIMDMKKGYLMQIMNFHKSFGEVLSMELGKIGNMSKEELLKEKVNTEKKISEYMEKMKW